MIIKKIVAAFTQFLVFIILLVAVDLLQKIFEWLNRACIPLKRKAEGYNDKNDV